MAKDEVKQMDELKRCPFCGSTPIHGVELYESRGAEVRLSAIVECSKCKVRKIAIFKATDYISLIPFWDYEKAFADVVMKWNTRAKEGEAE